MESLFCCVLVSTSHGLFSQYPGSMGSATWGTLEGAGCELSAVVENDAVVSVISGAGSADGALLHPASSTAAQNRPCNGRLAIKAPCRYCVLSPGHPGRIPAV